MIVNKVNTVNTVNTITKQKIKGVSINEYKWNINMKPIDV